MHIKGLILMNNNAVGPKSKQIYDLIVKRISGGELKPGDFVDSVRDMAEKFNVSRQAVCTAYDRLAEKNIIIREIGHGTYVNPNLCIPGMKRRLRFGYYAHWDNLENKFYNAVYHGCTRHGFELDHDVVNIPWSPGFDIVSQKESFDAFVVTGAVDDELCAEMKSAGKPFVIVGNYDLREEVECISLPLYDSTIALLSDVGAATAGSIGAVLADRSLPSTREISNAISAFSRNRKITWDEENIIYSNSTYAYLEILERSRRHKTWPDMMICTMHSFFGFARYIYEKGLDAGNYPKLVVKVNDKSFLPLPYSDLVYAVALDHDGRLGEAAVDRLMVMLGIVQDAGVIETDAFRSEIIWPNPQAESV